MKEHAYMQHVKSFPQPAGVRVVFLQALPGAPDSPTQRFAATLNSCPLRRSPAAPRFTPYSLDPVTTGSKPRWKLPLRTHPRWQLEPPAPEQKLPRSSCHKRGSFPSRRSKHIHFSQ